MGFKKDVIESQIIIRQDGGGIPLEFGVIYLQVSNVTLIFSHHECWDHGWFSDFTTFFPRSNIRNIGNEVPNNGKVAEVDSCVIPSVSSIDFVLAGMKSCAPLKAKPVVTGGICSPAFFAIIKASYRVTTSVGRVNALISIWELTKAVWRFFNETAPLSPILSDRGLFPYVEMERFFATINSFAIIKRRQTVGKIRTWKLNWRENADAASDVESRYYIGLSIDTN